MREEISTIPRTPRKQEKFVFVRKKKTVFSGKNQAGILIACGDYIDSQIRKRGERDEVSMRRNRVHPFTETTKIEIVHGNDDMEGPNFKSPAATFTVEAFTHSSAEQIYWEPPNTELLLRKDAIPQSLRTSLNNILFSFHKKIVDVVKKQLKERLGLQ